MTSSGSRVVVLREAKDDGAIPLVLVHPVTGESGVYAPLVERLAWPGAVIGVDALGVPPTFRELAAQHIDAVRAGYRTIPWCVAGWAAGGVIAAEMAVQLTEAGAAVAGVAIFDARAPLPELKTRPSDDDTLAKHYVDTVARRAGRDVTRYPTRADASEILDVLREVDAAPRDWDADVVASRFTIFSGIVRAFFAHDQRRIDVPVALFETQEFHPKHPKPATLGWEPHAATLVRAAIPGTHFTLMSEQYAAQLASIVDEVLPRLVYSPTSSTRS